MTGGEQLVYAALAPAHLRPWRCRCCGARHDALKLLCRYTQMPKDWR